MDIKTIFICLFIINLFLGFFVFAIKRTQKTFPGIDFWIIASFLIASGYLFLSLRNVIADLLSIVLAQSFFFLAGLLRIYGLKQFFKLKFTLSVNVLFSATFFAYVFLMFYFTYYQNNIFIRTIISGLFLSALAAYTGLLVLINRPDKNKTTYIFTAFVFFTFSFIFIFRIAGWILFPDIRDLFASAYINTIQFTSSMLIDITWSVMFFVIHNQKLTHELAVSESRFKNIFEKHHAVMLLIEPASGKIIEANNAAENFYGYNRSELSKLNMSDLITEKSAVNFQNDNFEAIDFQIFSHILANRTERIVEVHSTPIDLQGQNLLFSIIHDITERKKAEHALKESEEEFRAIFEKNSSAILILDEQTTVINANQTFFNITGYSREEIIGTSWTKLITENDLPRLSGYHEKRLSSHQDVPDKYEFSFYNKKREMKYGLMTVAYLPQKHNIIASFTDITERKEHEIQLQEFANELNKLNSDKDKLFPFWHTI